MKQQVGRLFRRIRNAVGKRGYWLRTVRGRDQWRAGIELLWHSIEPGHERVTVSSVFVNGRQIRFMVRDKDDWIQAHHFRGSLYAEDELGRIRQAYLGGVFVDVGANVGNHAVAAAMLFGAPKVIAFEPNPQAFRILRCNIALNDLNGTIEHISFGLSDHSASASPQSPEHGKNLGGTKLIEGDGNLQLRPGDDFLAETLVGFIKIDVEGSEMAALRGLEQTIARSRPPMLVEVDDQNRDEFRTWCSEHRYRVAEQFRVYDSNENFIIEPEA